MSTIYKAYPTQINYELDAIKLIHKMNFCRGDLNEIFTDY